MARSVLLLVNPHKPEVAVATEEIRALIEQHGTIIAELPADNEPLPDNLSRPDLIVVLGGDGTLLAQTRRCVELDAPMLGVNLGKIGFMAEFDMPSVRLQAESLFGAGPLAIRKLGLIHAEVHRGERNPIRFAGSALNDCVITAGPPYRLITLALTIDGTLGPTVHGDGLVISTPTGSTAYNLSTGGPIVAPTVEALSISPIAAQSLSFRPIVVGSSSIIEITMLRVNRASGEHGTTLVLDGQVHTPLNLGDRVLVTSHGRHVRFVRNPASDYWSRLINKLHWARAPRGRLTD
ncbi:MAG: NAD(+)/NADH kinase [Phycisphaerales bacterium]|nr:MAG: NAD(+)/NADH kinase [Phycisphaerales bacterium]